VKRYWQNIEQYLLISVSLSFLTGILLYNFFPLPQTITTGLSILLFIPALFFIRRAPASRSLFFLLLLVSSLGFSRLAHYQEHFIQEKNIYAMIVEETDVVLSGTLHSMPLFDGEKSTLLLDSNSLRRKQDSGFTSVTGHVLVKLYDKVPDIYRPGDELLVRCKISRPYRFGNPGGFNYPAYLATKNISLTGRIQSIAHIHGLQYGKSLLRKLRYLPEQIRCDIRDFLDNHFTHEHAAIYKALLIGDRSGIDKNRLESFKASGVVHIFAISGIHLSLVASTLFLVFYWLLKRSSFLLLRFSCKKLALLSTIPFLTAYALLAGAQTPVLRSLIMVIVFIIAFCVHRQRSPFTTLSFAALLILIENPSSLFTVSFQLSFVAVAALIVIFPTLKKWAQGSNDKDTRSIQLHKKMVPWTVAALLVSVTATLGTAPLLIHYFNRISTVGPLANLLLEPLLCLWSLPLGLMAIPFIYIAPSFSAFLLSIGNSGIIASLYLSDFFSNLSFSTLWFPTPSITVILSYYLAILFCFFKFSPKVTIPIFLLICSLFFFPPRAFIYHFSTESELIFLDVGQGSATLITFPQGKTILVDGGGASSKRFNVGESVIAPYLWYRGLTHLDAILISHPDADHYNGIPFLLERFRPEVLWVNGDDAHDQEYLDLLNLAKSLYIDIRKVENEEIILEREMTRLRNISNPFQNDSKASANDKSVVLRFSHSDFSCILPGDISERVEKELLHIGTALQANLLLAPHHGSKTSSSEPFLKKVDPQQIVVSAGRFRPNHFPSKQLRKYCTVHTIPLLNTASQGAIQINITHDTMTITPFKQ
jgi:competence protein ComEC